MATPKQVEALVQLARKACIKNNRPFNEALYRQGGQWRRTLRCKKSSRSGMGSLDSIAPLPMHRSSAALIRDLEGQVTGGAETDWTVFRTMTYEDADVRIKRLMADLRSKNTSSTFSAIVGGL